jgi:hypothetical protein
MFIHCSVLALTLSAMIRYICRTQITLNPEFSLPLLCLDMSCWLCRQQSHLMTENMILVLLFRQRWGCNHCCLRAVVVEQGAKHDCESLSCLVTQALGLYFTWDQRGGRELLVDSALPSLSVFQVNNAKSASSSCQHGRTSCPMEACLGLYHENDDFLES